MKTRISTSRAGTRTERQVRVAGVTITRPDKVWWPDEGVTKLDVVQFYADIAPHLLPWMARTSGARGLHVLVPLRRGATQDAVRAFAMDVGHTLADRAPALVTVEMSKKKRHGRVFADALRNAFGQTIVAPYCVRRRPKAPVSTPLDWDEVSLKLDPARYNIRTIERRLAGRDPWAEFWTQRQRLPELREQRSSRRAA